MVPAPGGRGRRGTARQLGHTRCGILPLLRLVSLDDESQCGKQTKDFHLQGVAYFTEGSRGGQPETTHRHEGQDWRQPRSLLPEREKVQRLSLFLQ